MARAVVQHELARDVLALIRSAYAAGRSLRYQEVAAELGRDPRTNSRAIAQSCDLLDAAAAYSGVPLLALVAVRDATGEVNERAWSSGPFASYRDRIIARSKKHRFTESDITAIGAGLAALGGLGNRAAWERVLKEGRTAILTGESTSLPQIPAAASSKRPTGAYWWEGDPGERYWLEATDRDDLGADLRAPEFDEAGRTNWRYALFKAAQPGDVVFHYHKPSEAIVALSVVAGPWRSEQVTWGARGTFARAKGVRPHARPGFVVPLAEYQQLPVPLSLATLREHKAELATILAELREQAGGRATYFPFELGSRPVRLLQGYAFKVPRALVAAFPELRGVALDDAVVPPEVAAAPAGTSRGGQRYVVSPEVRRAVECRAMEAAWVYFEAKGYTLTDVSRTSPFDLLATRRGEELRIEVKGTTAGFDTVFLTRNEVRHAEDYARHAVLFVLAEIVIVTTDGLVTATGGRERVYWPWVVADGVLEALQYQYTLPAASKAS